jgi:hypothetical protein
MIEFVAALLPNNPAQLGIGGEQRAPVTDRIR